MPNSKETGGNIDKTIFKTFFEFSSMQAIERKNITK